MFTDLFGLDWHHFDKIERDEEKKITIFDYEDFLPAEMLKHLDTNSDEFKRMIKEYNYNTRTTYERHKENQELFSRLMPLMAHLSEKEGKDMIHLLKNNKRLSYLKTLHSGEAETKLAKEVETENFKQKNRYWLETHQLDYADKTR